MLTKYVFILFILLSIPITAWPEQEQNDKSVELKQYNIQLGNAISISKHSPKKALTLVEDILLYTIKQEKKIVADQSLGILSHDNKALQNQTLELHAKALFALGQINDEQLFYDLAIQNYSAGLELYSSKLKIKPPYYIHKRMGFLYKKNKNYNSSLEEFEEFKERSTKLELHKDIIDANNEIAELYYIFGREDLAETYHKRALSIAEEQNFNNKIIETISLLGTLAELQKKNEKAISYYQKAQEIANSFGNLKVVNEEYNNITRVYQITDKEKALTNIEEAIKVNIKNEDYELLTKNQIELANTFTVLNKTNKAISTLKESIFLSQKNESYDDLAESLKSITKLYEKIDKPKLALESLKAYHIVLDTLQRIKQRNKDIKQDFGLELKAVQSKLEFFKKGKDLDAEKINLLKQQQNIQTLELRRKQKEFWYVLSGLILFIGTTLLFVRINQSRKRANKLLQLKSLRTQMNPHFIFNSLNSVNNFISKNDERSANKYISDFSKLMRKVLEYSQEDMISLDIEIEIIKLYLKLEHSRFKDKFDFEFRIDPNIDLSEISIPPMILQPFIENSIWHGLRYKPEKGMLVVKIEDKTSYLLIKISDDGIGRIKSSELKTKHQKNHKSTALKNIENRLTFIKQLYKTDLEISITNGKDNMGTVVNIKIFK